MRNIKLTESEWQYICDALGYGAIDLTDSWGDDFTGNKKVKYGTKEWTRKNDLLKRAERKIFNAKKEVA